MYNITEIVDSTCTLMYVCRYAYFTTHIWLYECVEVYNTLFHVFSAELLKELLCLISLSSFLLSSATFLQNNKLCKKSLYSFTTAYCLLWLRKNLNTGTCLRWVVLTQMISFCLCQISISEKHLKRALKSRTRKKWVCYLTFIREVAS